MSTDNDQDTTDYSKQDSKADSYAAVAILTIVIVTVVYWLSTL